MSSLGYPVYVWDTSTTLADHLNATGDEPLDADGEPEDPTLKYEEYERTHDPDQ